MATSTKTKPAKKCPVSKQDFDKHAKPLTLSIDGKDMALNPHEFSTGSFGYRCSESKMTVNINGKLCTLVLGINLIVAHSKPQ